jgi:hypothetical protein
MKKSQKQSAKMNSLPAPLSADTNKYIKMVHRVKCTSTTRGPCQKYLFLYCFCFLILGVTGRAKKGKKAAGIILCLAEPGNGFDLSAQIKCQMRAGLSLSLPCAQSRIALVFTSPFCICVHVHSHDILTACLTNVTTVMLSLQSCYGRAPLTLRDIFM